MKRSQRTLLFYHSLKAKYLHKSGRQTEEDTGEHWWNFVDVVGEVVVRGWFAQWWPLEWCWHIADIKDTCGAASWLVWPGIGGSLMNPKLTCHVAGQR